MSYEYKISGRSFLPLRTENPLKDAFHAMELSMMRITLLYCGNYYKQWMSLLKCGCCNTQFVAYLQDGAHYRALFTGSWSWVSVRCPDFLTVYEWFFGFPRRKQKHVITKNLLQCKLLLSLLWGFKWEPSFCTKPFLSGIINIPKFLIHFPKSNKLLLSMLWEFKWEPKLYAKLLLYLECLISQNSN